MAEPAGILLRAYITEAELAAFFRRQVDYGEGQASVGHVLSALLDRDEFGCDILIVHHDAEYDRPFLAWIPNRLVEDDPRIAMARPLRITSKPSVRNR